MLHVIEKIINGDHDTFSAVILSCTPLFPGLPVSALAIAAVESNVTLSSPHWLLVLSGVEVVRVVPVCPAPANKTVEEDRVSSVNLMRLNSSSWNSITFQVCL